MTNKLTIVRKLSKKDLVNLANLLHGGDWVVENDVLVPVYKAMVKREPYLLRQSKEDQRVSLTQWYYRNAAARHYRAKLEGTE